MRQLKLIYLLLSFVVFVGCEKEETLKINITDSTTSPFYLSMMADDNLIEKNLSWYGGFSFFRERYSSREEEFVMQYTWTALPPSSLRSSHFEPSYYEDMNEGFIRLEISDSTLFDKIIGTTVSSDQYGDTLHFRMAFATANNEWESIGSVFNFKINSVKDTLMPYLPINTKSNYKIVELEIPEVQMRHISDTTQSIAVEKIQMRFPIIYFP